MPQAIPIRGQHINIANPLARGLVGYWPMLEGTGDTLHDCSGNSNDSAINNMDPTDAWVASERGHAIESDGVDGYLVADVESEKITDAGRVALSFWCKIPVFTNLKGILSLGTFPTDFAPFMLFQSTAVGARFYVGDAYKFTWVFPANEWNHFAAIHDGTSWRGWMNGIEEPPSVSAIGASEFDGMYIGSGYNGYLKAVLQDIRLYNRPLSHADVTENMRNPWGLFSMSSNSIFISSAPPSGRIMGSLVGQGGLVGPGGIIGQSGGIVA